MVFGENAGKKVYVIILNYNTWEHTIACLRSVLMSDYKEFQILLVDNGSTNGSIQHIKKWLSGERTIADLSEDVWYPVCHESLGTSPVPFVEYNQYDENPETSLCDSCEAFSGLFLRKSDDRRTRQTAPLDLLKISPVVLIRSAKNLGFAGGVNLGIKHALRRNDFNYVWVLNNDTVVDKYALSSLVRKAEEYARSKKKLAILGSKLLYMDETALIQAVGGKYYKWIGKSKHLGALEVDRGQWDKPVKIDYVVGASMFLTKDFLFSVGLMCEEYFLYFEDIDWSIRARKGGWAIDCCYKSKVYHWEGLSVEKVNKRGSFSLSKLKLVNKIKLTRKFYPECLVSIYPFVLMGFIKLVAKHIMHYFMDES